MASVSVGSVPGTMLHPDQLDAGDTWLHDCEVCEKFGNPLPIQGGMPGLVAHVATVHT